MVSRIVLTGIIAASLAACAPAPKRPVDVTTEPVDAGKTPPAVTPPAADPGVRRASDSLLADARAARADGALSRAEALLQRAQRIDPGNAGVYLELAELYALRGRQKAAASVAERGLLYCDGASCDSLRELAKRQDQGASRH